jgi:L-lactate dehydrogenase complex protein LldG
MNDNRNARDRILAALRAHKPMLEASPRPDSYRPVTLPPSPDLVARFTTELERLTGKVYNPSDAEAAIAQVVALIGEEKSVLMGDSLPLPGLAEALTERRIHMVMPNIRGESRQESLKALEPVQIGITGAVAGLATTGTLALATHFTGARLVSLLPLIHIALLPHDRLFPNMESWLAADGKAAILNATSVYFITGPSRTSDIEMQTILGVHGPGQVHVILLPATK